ncbi:MAG: MotA/TolQ/ExbB proton channel family protein [Phycisphaerales bacterium]
MMRDRALVVSISACLFPIVFAVPTVLAQDDAATGTGRSFAGAFFISLQKDGSIELLGSLIIWFLLALSVLSIGLIGHMALTNQRKSILPEGVAEEVRGMLKANRFKDALALTEKDESYFSRVLRAGLHEASSGYGAMVRGLELASDEETTNRLRRIEYLNVLGQVSPMIGLFGTVYGMILAFQAIVISGGSADPIALAGGIGTALTTTFWGLIVAIPALAGYAIVRNRIDALTTEATHLAEQMVNQFRPRAGGQSMQPRPEPRPTAPAPAPAPSPPAQKNNPS